MYLDKINFNIYIQIYSFKANMSKINNFQKSDVRPLDVVCMQIGNLIANLPIAVNSLKKR